MSDHPLTFFGAALAARPSGALWWASERLLAVSDLHLGKSERMARRGGPLLPPYEGTDTLLRLDSEIAALAPRTVICLGDSFDDAEARLSEDEALWLARLMAGRRCGEVAGHYHPKARLAGRSRPCFLVDAARIVMPAFGTYTGGLSCTAPDLRALMGDGALAVLTGPQALAVPLAAL